MPNLDAFHFLRPGWLFLIIPVCWLVFRLHHSLRRKTDWSSVVESHLLELLLVGGRGIRKNGTPWLLSSILVLILLALAGPVLEQRLVPVLKKNLARVLVLDVSHSMLAEDLRPNRIERAKFKLRDLLNLIQEGETALVAYAGDAHVISPLTSDTQTIITLLPGLEPNIMPHQGSRPDRAMKLAVSLLDDHSAKPGEVIWITDGISANMIQPVTQILGFHRLSVIGVGTEKGAPIPGKNNGFIKNSNGGIVMSRLDSSTLQMIALEKGGIYQILSSDDQDLEMLLYQSPLESEYIEDGTDKKGDVWREEGPWLLLILLPMAAMVFRKGILFSVLVICLQFYMSLMPEVVLGFEWKDLWKNKNQQAEDLFSQGQHKQASTVFENQEWKGLSFYRSGEHEKALEAWKGDDSSRSLFNQGNSLAKLGNYKKAIDYYDKVLQGEPDHSDARFNRELIKKLLEDQEKQNQSSSNQKSSGENQEKNNQDESNKPSSESDPSKKNQGLNESQQNLNQQDLNDSEMERNSETEESSSLKDSESLQEKKDEEENLNQTSLAEEKKEGLNEKTEKSSYIKPRSSPKMTEENSQQQELRQWLKKVPDDPARLLRNKMFRAYQRNLKNLNTEIESW